MSETLGIMLALLERAQSGLGQWVQSSLLQAQIFMLDFQASRWLNAGEVPKQAGNNHPTSVPTGVFKTADGHINIASAGGKIWQRLCETLGAPEWCEDPRFATGAARSANRDALTDLINDRLAGTGSAAWIERLNEAGVPCGPIYSIDQVFADPQVKALGIVQTVDSPHYDPLRLVGQPMTLSRTPSEITRAPPEIGEHSDELLQEFGYSADAIAGFRTRGII